MTTFNIVPSREPGEAAHIEQTCGTLGNALATVRAALADGVLTTAEYPAVKAHILHHIGACTALLSDLESCVVAEGAPGTDRLTTDERPR